MDIQGGGTLEPPTAHLTQKGSFQLQVFTDEGNGISQFDTKSKYVQGDHSGCYLGLVDIKTKVVF